VHIEALAKFCICITGDYRCTQSLTIFTTSDIWDLLIEPDERLSRVSLQSISILSFHEASDLEIFESCYFTQYFLIDPVDPSGGYKGLETFLDLECAESLIGGISLRIEIIPRAIEPFSSFLDPYILTIDEFTREEIEDLPTFIGESGHMIDRVDVASIEIYLEGGTTHSCDDTLLREIYMKV
jgi:hypothetical protein